MSFLAALHGVSKSFSGDGATYYNYHDECGGRCAASVVLPLCLRRCFFCTDCSGCSGRGYISEGHGGFGGCVAQKYQPETFELAGIESVSL